MLNDDIQNNSIQSNSIFIVKTVVVRTELRQYGILKDELK